MQIVAQVAYQPNGTWNAVCLPITQDQAVKLYHRGMECFDTFADAQWWLVRNRKPGSSLTLASIFEHGGFCLIGLAQT